METLQIIVWGLYAGAVLGFAGTVYAKRVPGKVVRALNGQESWTADGAKTLEELGIRPTAAIRRELRHGTTLRRYVAAVAEDEAALPLPEEKRGGKFLRKLFSRERTVRYRYNFGTQRWYLREESRFEAAVRYDTKGCNIPMIFLGSVLLLAVAVAILLVFPYLANFYEAALKAITG